VDAEELISTFPRLYHMAHVNAWPGIKRHGLLSTSALLDLFGVRGSSRKALEQIVATTASLSIISDTEKQ